MKWTDWRWVGLVTHTDSCRSSIAWPCQNLAEVSHITTKRVGKNTDFEMNAESPHPTPLLHYPFWWTRVCSLSLSEGERLLRLVSVTATVQYIGKRAPSPNTSISSTFTVSKTKEQASRDSSLILSFSFYPLKKETCIFVFLSCHVNSKPDGTLLYCQRWQSVKLESICDPKFILKWHWTNNRIPLQMNWKIQNFTHTVNLHYCIV